MRKIVELLKYIYQTFIFTPLAGGNGKIQADEMTKLVIVVLIIRASIREGWSEEQLYPDIYWMSIFAAVCGIAMIKPMFGKPKDKDDGTQP